MTSSPPSDARALFGLARRHNPKRSRLFVSTVLAKHVPVDPRTGLAAGRLLAQRAARALDASAPCDAYDALMDGGAADHLARQPLPPLDVVVLGFCETAVGLGATVADAFGATYVHSTRYPRPGQHRLVAFEETHSHATSHILTHLDPEVLANDAALVLVDDELSTGATALALIEGLQARWPRQRYVIAVLLDWRPAASDEQLRDFEARTGASVEVVSLYRGDADEHPAPDPTPAPAIEGTPSHAPSVELIVMPEVREATPWAGDGSKAAHADAIAIAEVLRDHGVEGIVGIEECMYLPLLIAAELGVTAQSTTLSPVVVSHDEHYPVRSAVALQSPFGGAASWVYNVPVGRRLAVVTDGGDPDLNMAVARAISSHTGLVVDLVLTAKAADRLIEHDGGAPT